MNLSMNCFAEANWQLVAEAHGGETRPAGKTRWISLQYRPKVGRTQREWMRYYDALVDLLLLAGRGGAGLRLHVGYSGVGRFLVRDA